MLFLGGGEQKWGLVKRKSGLLVLKQHSKSHLLLLAKKIPIGKPSELW